MTTEADRPRGLTVPAPRPVPVAWRVGIGAAACRNALRENGSGPGGVHALLRVEEAEREK